MRGVIAHQGGWDEILFVVGPILVVVGLLLLLKKRVQRTVSPPEPAAPAAEQISPDDE